MRWLADENFPSGSGVPPLIQSRDGSATFFQAGHKASCGVVLFRISTPSSSVAAQKVLDALSQRTDWPGHFSTVDDHGIRTVKLPEVKP